MAIRPDNFALFPSPKLRAIGAKAITLSKTAIAGMPYTLWALLTLRLLIAVCNDAFNSWPSICFAAGCFVAGITLNRSAPIAWLITTPFVATCAYFGLLAAPEPLVLGFCCLSVGLVLRGKSLRLTFVPSHALWLDGLATWITIGMVWHWGDMAKIAAVTPALMNQTVFGFDDPLFLVTNTHLWLTAWILYRQWLTRQPTASDGHFYTKEAAVGWMAIWISVIGFTWLVQRHYQFPEMYNGFVAFGPFEDIHAFGSVVGALLVGLLCRLRPNRSGSAIALIGAAALVLVVFSYSRATWLWVGVGTMGVICLVCSRKAITTLGIIGLGLLGTIHGLAPRLRTLNQPYTDRFAALVQVERWGQQDAPRLHYYMKSLDMIRTRPWFGYGTGSARRLNGDFIHNFVLQIAAESGLPAAIFFLLGLAGVILSAARALRRRIASIETKALLAAALTYLGTQFTANAVNIYPTQVFFFWPLLAMLYLSAQRDLHAHERTMRAVRS